MHRIVLFSGNAETKHGTVNPVARRRTLQGDGLLVVAPFFHLRSNFPPSVFHADQVDGVRPIRIQLANHLTIRGIADVGGSSRRVGHNNGHVFLRVGSHCCYREECHHQNLFHKSGVFFINRYKDIGKNHTHKQISLFFYSYNQYHSFTLA